MLRWTRDKFRLVTEIALWINIITCPIVGVIIGNGLKTSAGVILGLVLGLLTGLITNVIFGGVIATFLNIDENLEEIRTDLLEKSSVNKNVQGIHDHLLGIKPQENQKTVSRSALDNF